MICNHDYEYIFFTIAIIIWTIYSFFEENDKEFLEKYGINPEEIEWFFPNYENKKKKEKITTYTTTSNHNTLPNIKDKCKRNFKITIDKK